MARGSKRRVITEELANMVALLDTQTTSEDCDQVEPLLVQDPEFKMNIPSIIQPSELELKLLPKQLRYVFLETLILFLLLFLDH